jgi:hypothetical protein
MDNDESEDVGQGQTRVECLWKKTPSQKIRSHGVAKGWYANNLIWPKALDQRVEQGDLIGQVHAVRNLSAKV